MTRPDKNSVSLAGEFAVLSQLALRNFNASLTLGNTKGVDILVSDPNKKMYRLEVKTTRQRGKKDFKESKIFGTFLDKWIMNEKHERIVDPLLFYCFVLILERGKEKRFRFFILPSGIVAKYVKEEHRHWREANRKEGNRVKGTEMRTFRMGLNSEAYDLAPPLDDAYEDNWKFSAV